MISTNVRIHIAEDHHPIYQQLVKRGNDDPDNYPFATMKDLFMMAATVGLKNGKYKPKKATKDIFAGSVFDQKNDIPVLAAIAYAHKKDFEVLFNEQEMIQIVEGYACGGINILSKELLRPNRKAIFNLINYVLI